MATSFKSFVGQGSVIFWLETTLRVIMVSLQRNPANFMCNSETCIEFHSFELAWSGLKTGYGWIELKTMGTLKVSSKGLFGGI